MITCISRLKDVGVFKDFTWPTSLPVFSRYNLLYGWNGSGKSTIARLFQSLQDRTVPEGEAQLLICGNLIDQTLFPDSGVSIKVFNRDYVEKTIGLATRFPNRGVAPIYIIGKENVEMQNEADRLRTEVTTMEEQLSIATTTKRETEQARDAFFTTQARDIKTRLTGQGSAYNNYNRSDIIPKLEIMAIEADHSSHILDDTQLTARIKQHLSTPKDGVTEVTYAFPDLPLLYSTVTTLLAKTVTTATIESLRNDPSTASWVEMGLALHTQRKITTCLFCGQTIPAPRFIELEAHFSKTYKQFIDEINATTTKIQGYVTSATGIRLPDKAKLYDHLAVEYEQSSARFHSQLDIVCSALSVLAKKLVEKRDKPFDALAFSDVAPIIDTASLAGVNTTLQKHNQTSRDFAQEIKKARQELEAAYIAGLLPDFNARIQATKSAVETVDSLYTKLSQTKTTIEDIERKVLQHRLPADELNRDLANYLGHPDITFIVEQTGYRVSRNGQPATLLSEGELTAIALLYFLVSLKDRRFDLSQGIVVLDDPVCSLDQNGIFSAFGFIKERTKDAKQLFILTHNYTFFRQVWYWFKKLPNQNKSNAALHPATFTMVRASFIGNERQSFLYPLDPLLLNSESDYHYLFKCICEMAGTTGLPLTFYYGAPNMARRLVEMFLAFRVPHRSDLWAKLETVSFDENKKNRIYRFVNTYSHADAIGGEQQDFSSLSETPTVLRTILEMVHSTDAPHYESMMKLDGMPADPLLVIT